MKIIPVISPVNGYVFDIKSNEIIIRFDKDFNYKDYILPANLDIMINKDLLSVHFNDIYHINAITKGAKLISGKNVIAFLIILDDPNQYIKIDRAFNTLTDEQKIDIVKIFIKDQEFKHLKQLIVLTTPHQKCKYSNEFQHKCDYYAPILAKSLIDQLDKNDKEIFFVQGNQNRQDIDLNRKEGKFTNFRNTIRRRIFHQINKVMDSNIFTEKNIVIIIDCHSFSNTNQFDTIRIKNPDVAILFPKYQQLDIIEELSDLLKEEKIVSVKKFAYDRDDIVQEYANLDNLYDEKIIIIPILLEINEILPIEKINRISFIINKWIAKINQYYMNQFKN